MEHGVAIDVGTTNLSISLVNLSTKAVLGSLSLPNPQSKYGADILTRYSAAVKDCSVRLELHSMIVSVLRDSVRKICADHPSCKVGRLVIVGNTIMYAFLMNEDCMNFIRRKTTISDYHAVEGPVIVSGVKTMVFPPLASYVGSDALAVLLSTGIHKSESVQMVVDFGTNSEILVGNRDRILLTSVAGGAAFEDPSMSFSSQAADGAVYQASYYEGSFAFKFLGKKALSLCGSGILDIVAEAKRHGLIDASGRLAGNGIMLTESISITQKDIRAVQLAKAATRAAIDILTASTGKVTKLYVAGNFGNYLNLDNARLIGLIPALDSQIVKDCAVKGAAMLLEDLDLAQIISRLEFVDLPSHPSFQERFIGSMVL
ncbi:MAG: ASKHA domain-containing protein [Candidatus Woesearchaeota archaeon]